MTSGKLYVALAAVLSLSLTSGCTLWRDDDRPPSDKSESHSTVQLVEWDSLEKTQPHPVTEASGLVVLRSQCFYLQSEGELRSIVWPPNSDWDNQSRTVTIRDGSQVALDVPVSLTQVTDTGEQPSPLERLSPTACDPTSEPVIVVDQQQLDEWSTRINSELGRNEERAALVESVYEDVVLTWFETADFSFPTFVGIHFDEGSRDGIIGLCVPEDETDSDAVSTEIETLRRRIDDYLTSQASEYATEHVFRVDTQLTCDMSPG